MGQPRKIYWPAREDPMGQLKVGAIPAATLNARPLRFVTATVRGFAHRQPACA